VETRKSLTIEQSGKEGKVFSTGVVVVENAAPDRVHSLANP